MHSGRFYRIKNSRGFTLIEVIVSLIVAGILGTMLVSFMGTGVMQSANPVILAQDGAYINSIMENMGNDYKLLMLTSSSPMSTFIVHVGAEGSNQTRYSDNTHSYKIISNHRTSFPLDGTNVTETGDSNGKVLKVTIQYQDLSATALFTE
jgi:prepilin-type N-terminal cleavage/methylation domain-containing protein